jgi:hypothetical protein
MAFALYFMCTWEMVESDPAHLPWPFLIWEFPFDQIPGQEFPLIVSSPGDFMRLALANALLWGLCAVGFWHAFAAIAQQRNRAMR